MHHAVNQKIKKRAVHRLKILRGQVDALAMAVEREVYCTELLHQSYSIQQSLRSLDTLLLENHLLSHVHDQMKKKDQYKKAITELIDIYTFSSRR